MSVRRQLKADHKKIDFNADNYDIEELIAILKFEDMPLNIGKIQETYEVEISGLRFIIRSSP